MAESRGTTLNVTRNYAIHVVRGSAYSSAWFSDIKVSLTSYD